MVFLTLFAANITANNTNNEPSEAAAAIAQLESAKDAITPPRAPEPRIRMATPRLAPEEIPNTKGPARGFLNNVCIRRPLIPRPEPTRVAVRALGNLKFKTMRSQLDLELDPPDKISKRSGKGIATEPKLILNSKKRSNTSVRAMNCLVYVFCGINCL